MGRVVHGSNASEIISAKCEEGRRAKKDLYDANRCLNLHFFNLMRGGRDEGGNLGFPYCL